MTLRGEIISGEFDEKANAFMLREVKHFVAETSLNENQLTNLLDYLSKNKHDIDGQVLTLYDQMPVRLNQEEVGQFLNDLEDIKSRYYNNH
ncbi:hypothetical protein SAMN05216238_107153 [Lentibacillus persicus]|uniref:Uncharacterized protein n=1 Tax=Lentibacillus persicus TaxID=640948 RepID=A0A1I1XDF8_9BACI|nr:hypothetical protein [Lentibacillus persicus]SFE03773.1 hypothetical protein SAMN05216238_107153 [Lentibacillus persicus]